MTSADDMARDFILEYKDGDMCGDCSWYDVDHQGDPLMPVSSCFAEDTEPCKCPAFADWISTHSWDDYIKENRGPR